MRLKESVRSTCSSIMRPSQLEPFGSERTETGSSRRQVWSQEHLNLQTRSHQSTRRSRFEGILHLSTIVPPNMDSPNSDSWIDIASQPSSSSLASPNNPDEIITTGLQVRRQNLRRSRHLRLSNTNPTRQPQPRSNSVAGSSQDEYEESESESDRVMSSSNEEISNHSNAEEEEEEEAEYSQTAPGLPVIERNVFTPQPNAFSHPPQLRSVPATNQQAVNSYFPPEQPPPVNSHRLPSNRVPTIQRPSVPRTTTNITPDHDAALRASLTTLLSCANAVRKDREPVPVIPRSNQPTTLRLVPESELHARRSPPRSPKLAPKRKSRESSKERQAKKLRAVTKQAHTSDELLLSPTMMTWFISAGVVLVFSAISFSAGYAWGKEVGRVEGQMGFDGINCGREAMRGSRTGLSKLRLSTVKV